MNTTKKTTMKALAAVLALTICTVACTDDPMGPNADLEAAGFGSPPMASGWQAVDVLTFEDDAVVGSSRIKRGDRHVNVTLEAGGLEPGTAATLWAVVFNDASACVGECDDPDLFDNAATMADLMFVAGSVADGQGRIRFAGRLGEGSTVGTIMPLFGLPAYGVMDTDVSEIHLVVRSHGPVLPGLVDEQTSTFNGGCTGFGAEFGAPGPNECADLYYASHYAN